MAAPATSLTVRKTGLHTLADLPPPITGFVTDRRTLEEFYKYVEENGHFLAVQQMRSETSDSRKVFIGMISLSQSLRAEIHRDRLLMQENRALTEEVAQRVERIIASSTQALKEENDALSKSILLMQERGAGHQEAQTARQERRTQWELEFAEIEKKSVQDAEKYEAEVREKTERQIREMREREAQYQALMTAVGKARLAIGLSDYSPTSDEDAVKALIPKIHELLQQKQELAEKVRQLQQGNARLSRPIRLMAAIVEFVRRMFQYIHEKWVRFSLYDLGQHIFTYRNQKRVILCALAIVFLAIYIIK